MSLSENSVNARACNACYEILRDEELRAHVWNFAVARASLPADAAAPTWGRQTSCQLPSDFLRLAAHYPELNANDIDWQIEGQKILTNDLPPLNIRYVRRVTDTTVMDPLFIGALSSRMAMEMAEELTQSNTKKDAASKDYQMFLSRAEKTNAYENVAGLPPEDTYLTARQ